MNALHRPSFELKLRRNAWAAGAPPRTQLGAYSTSPEPLARLRGPISKGDGRGEERGSGTPTLWEKVKLHPWVRVGVRYEGMQISGTAGAKYPHSRVVVRSLAAT